MMTNKQHDDLWMGAFEKIPTISNSLRRTNGLTVAKELYKLGKISEEDYIQALVYLGEIEGFKFDILPD